MRKLAQALLTREIPIDFQSIREASETLIGSIFWRMVGSAISLTDTTGQAWEYLQGALLDAAADDRITLLEVLQNLDVGLMILDTQRLMELSSRIGIDFEDAGLLLSIFLRGFSMTPTSSSLVLSFEEFLARYKDNPRYELADGELADLEPTGSHENVAGKVASKLSIEIDRQGHPWVIPRTCVIRPFADIATARRPDVVVLDEPALADEPLWAREPVIVAEAPQCKSSGWGVLSSTNWETDYARQVEEYALFGIPEYGS